jgi:hypothetical protein
MALFGNARDINLFTTVNRELLRDIISQQVGYYKIQLQQTVSNLYGEAAGARYYSDPFLINCLISPIDQTWDSNDMGPDVNHSVTVNFLREDLIDVQLVPEVGDVFTYVDNYFEVDTIADNQFIVGKDFEHAYSPDLLTFGRNFSITVTAHLIPSDKLGLSKERT